MREIKFRGKRIDNGKWVYGSLIIEPNLPKFLSIYSDVKNSGKSKYLIYPIDAKDGRAREVNPESIGQYIGIRNINRVEMYERDIIKYHDDFYSDPADIGGRRHIVKDRLYIIWWHPLKTAFWRKSIPGIITSPILSLDCEIVGNIIDNPELLEEKK